MESLLRLEGFGLAFEQRVILRDVSFDIPMQGCTVLLGPAGTGKSSLLRTLSGLMAGNSRLRLWGNVVYRGQAWGSADLPVLVEQKPQLLVSSVWDNLVLELPNRARMTRSEQSEEIGRLLNFLGQEHLMTQLAVQVIDLPVPQQRIIAILRKAMAQPALLMVDEPTAHLKDQDAAPINRVLKKLARKTPLLVVSHHQGQTRELADRVILMANGVVQEDAATELFFTEPRSEAARSFLRSGSCPEIGLGEVDDVVADLPQGATAAVAPVTVQAAPATGPVPRVALQPVANYRPAVYGPRGFVWLLDGLVAGTPQPGVGVVHDADGDLRSLREVGISRLVSLTEAPFDAALAADHGIQCAFNPIPDMHPPTLSQAVQLCHDIDLYCSKGEAVAVHCKAGLGRTGTILAAYWIWHKQGKVRGSEAVAHIRRLEPRMIQSTQQEEFLTEFATELRTMSLTFQDQAEPVSAI